MKLSKKIPALGLTLAMALSLAACGGNATESKAPEESKAAESTAVSEAPKAEGLKIAICTSPNTVDDGSFNEDNYDGILAFIASRDNIDTVTPVQEPTGDPAAAAQTVSDIVADYDILVCTGFQFAGIATIAQDNPDKSFILVDSFPSADGADVEVENVYAMQFAEQEGGFFAGIAAAMETQTGKVAVVNGVAYPSNVNYQFGFESGVNYANKHYGTTAQCVELPSYAGVDLAGTNVGGNYIGDFADEATGKVVGDALVAEGCDVLFVAAGNAGNGTFTAAKEADGVWLIGCDIDQYDDGAKGSENIMLTSTLKKMDTHVQKQLTAIYDGTFVGEDAFLSVSTDGVGYVSEDGRQQLSEETLEKLAECYELVKDGTIVPAADATVNDYTPDNFPGL